MNKKFLLVFLRAEHERNWGFHKTLMARSGSIITYEMGLIHSKNLIKCVMKIKNSPKK